MPERFTVLERVKLIETPRDGGPAIGDEGIIIRIDHDMETAERGQHVYVHFDHSEWTEGGYGYDDNGKEYQNCWWVEADRLAPVETRAFYLVGIVDGKEVVMSNEPTFVTGSEAAAHAKKLTVELGHKVQPRRFKDDSDAWRDREKLRIADGTYLPMPDGWNLVPINDHFLHRSKDEPFMVAYTESVERGILDRQTRTTPGRYLERFYSHLGQEERKRLIATVDGPDGVYFAKTADDIVNVYLRGPRSCMAHDLDDYSTEIHPVSVYGDSDLQVAYLKSDARVTARALVWPEKKLIGRIYGDEARLRRALTDLGYAVGPVLDGARVRKIVNEDDGEFVLPYIDHSGTVWDPDPEDPDGWLILGRGGNVYAESTNGLGQTMKYCPQSKTWGHRRHFRYVHGAEEEWNVNNARAIRIRNGAGQEEYWTEDQVVLLLDRGWFPKKLLEGKKNVVSEISGGKMLEEDAVQLHDGKFISKAEARDYAAVCQGNGKLYLRNEISRIHGYSYSNAYLAEHPEIRNAGLKSRFREKGLTIDWNDLRAQSLSPLGINPAMIFLDELTSR